MLEKDVGLTIKSNRDLFAPDEDPTRSKPKSRNPAVGAQSAGMNSTEKALFNSNKEGLIPPNLQFNQQFIDAPDPAPSASTQDDAESTETGQGNTAALLSKQTSQGAGTGETRNNQQPSEL